MYEYVFCLKSDAKVEAEKEKEEKKSEPPSEDTQVMFQPVLALSINENTQLSRL